MHARTLLLYSWACRLGALLAGWLAATAALAGPNNVTGTINVTASTVPACSVAAGNLAFGNVPVPMVSPVAASATVNVTCSTGVPYSVLLGGGNTPNAGSRTLGGPGLLQLPYNVYTDAQHNTVWGDNNATLTGGSVLGGTGNGLAQPFTVYGLIPIPANTLPPNVSFTDSITVTVNF